MNNTNIVFIVKRSNFDVASSRPFFKALLFELTFKNHTRRISTDNNLKKILYSSIDWNQAISIISYFIFFGVGERHVGK